MLQVSLARRVTAGEPSLRNDADLIDACLAGDASAWEQLLARYGRLIYSVALRLGLRESDAADCYQTVCVILLEKLGQLRDRTKLSSWLITTTTREARLVSMRRSRMVPLTSENGDEDPIAQQPDGGPLPDEEAVLLEEQALVRDAVQHLPERCRTLLSALFYERPTPPYAEIGLRLGMPEPSIGPTRGRCLERLRIALARIGFE